MNKTCLLDELNELMSTVTIVPEYTRTVHHSGKNYKFLKKNISKNPNVPERVRELLSMSLNELTKPYDLPV